MGSCQEISAGQVNEILKWVSDEIVVFSQVLSASPSLTTTHRYREEDKVLSNAHSTSILALLSPLHTHFYKPHPLFYQKHLYLFSIVPMWAT